ncbi:16S rRNA processing protein RimM [hydrothermal vent metagenome]|uniref:16S rRNA processing protein RimM n=1 Tax=hydrothermal vent metagenome TaxID=652676 RepID=A0A1W1BH61_9ZZZZ
MNKSQRFFIAQVGKTHGLHGDLKLHLHTDFPEQFKAGYTFQSSVGLLEVNKVNLTRGLISFKGYSGVDYAKKLTNAKIYASLEETKERCKLKEDEHFWFEIEACSVMEDGVVLGKISQMQRLANVDYMFINTDESLVKEGLPSTFLVPYIDRYIVKKDMKDKIIFTKDAKDILEAS